MSFNKSVIVVGGVLNLSYCVFSVVSFCFWFMGSVVVLSISFSLNIISIYVFHPNSGYFLSVMVSLFIVYLFQTCCIYFYKIVSIGGFKNIKISMVGVFIFFVVSMVFLYMGWYDDILLLSVKKSMMNTSLQVQEEGGLEGLSFMKGYVIGLKNFVFSVIGCCYTMSLVFGLYVLCYSELKDKKNSWMKWEFESDYEVFVYPLWVFCCVWWFFPNVTVSVGNFLFECLGPMFDWLDVYNAKDTSYEYHPSSDTGSQCLNGVYYFTGAMIVNSTYMYLSIIAWVYMKELLVLNMYNPKNEKVKSFSDLCFSYYWVVLVIAGVFVYFVENSFLIFFTMGVFMVYVIMGFILWVLGCFIPFMVKFILEDPSKVCPNSMKSNFTDLAMKVKEVISSESYSMLLKPEEISYSLHQMEEELKYYDPEEEGASSAVSYLSTNELITRSSSEAGEEIIHPFD